MSVKTATNWLNQLDPSVYGLYDAALITDDGIQTKQFTPSSRSHNSYSVAKALTMTAVGMLYDQNKLDVSERVLPLLHCNLPKAIDPHWAQVTVEHALLHTIGFSEGFLDIDTEDASLYPSHDYLALVLAHNIPHTPGTHRQYSDAAYYLLSRVVAERAGMPLDCFLSDTLFRKMQFREVAWSHCPHGHPMGATGLYISTADMAKLGWVYLNGGYYGTHQIISQKWIDLSIQKGYEWKQVGEDLYTKGGMYGQALAFAPKRRFAIACHAMNIPKDGQKSLLEGLNR